MVSIAFLHGAVSLVCEDRLGDKELESVGGQTPRSSELSLADILTFMEFPFSKHHFTLRKEVEERGSIHICVSGYSLSLLSGNVCSLS